MRNRWCIITVLSILTLSSETHAGVYGENLGKCIVTKTTAADRSALMRFVFMQMTLHPEFKQYASISDAEFDQAAHRYAELIQRLEFQDCRKETINALKNEGPSGLRDGFIVVGTLSMQNIMLNPAVSAGLQRVAKFVDFSKLNILMKEAGIKAQTSKH